ncbi:MAG: PPC domain-containing protein [Gemmataceae bacterium]
MAPDDGDYQVRIQDSRMLGGPEYVYRLTLTTEPHVDGFFPLGGRRGATLKLSLLGQGTPASPIEIAIPAAAASEHVIQLDLAGKKSDSIALDIDDLPEHLEAEPNDDPDKVAPLAVPAVLNGRIEKAGDVDWWAFPAKKGDTVEIELRAGQLGSPLLGVLRLCDGSGKELARAETAAGKVDPSLRLTAPADGIYRIAVADRFASRGGPDFAYRLRVAHPAAPDFRLSFPVDTLAVPRKEEAKLKLSVDRLGGFKDAIALTIDGLPAGVKVMNPTIAPGQGGVDLVLKADEAASITAVRLKIHGDGKIGDKTVRRTASLKTGRGAAVVDTVLCAVSLPTPFVIKGEYDMGFAARGSVRERKYKIERNGFDGPIEVSLADRQARHLQGVTGPTIVVPAGASEFTYPCSLPPWMEMGRTCRVCVMGVGTVKDKDGTEHRVSFSSVNQNEQLVAVVGPGKLALELERASLTLRPGKTASLSVQVKRAPDVKGPVKIDLIVPAHIRGVKAAPLELTAGQDEGRLTLQADVGARDAINMPLTVRATLVHDGRPWTAEVKLDVQRE